MNVALIGPVTEAWGGPSRGGGVSSYVQGLASALADLDVRLSLLGDNTNAASASLQTWSSSSIQFYPMFRLAGRSALRALSTLGPGRLTKMATRLLMQQDARIPWRQRLRYVDRAANYDRFLSQAKPQLIHVAHAEFRQFLSQRIVAASVPMVASVLSGTVLLRRPLSDWLVQLTIQNYNRAARLIVCSAFVKEVVRPHLDEPSKMIVIPNGTNTDRFRSCSQAQARAVLDLDPHDFLVLFTGSLVAEKGVAQLLQAFARSMAMQPNARLVFVGTGRKTDALEKLAGELGVARQISLVGYRPDDELPDWYAACDVFALPTQSEGLSISLLEAMASARPVITTYPDIGAHDAVEDGVNGLLCPYDDVDALTAALSTLAQSPDKARRMGISARKKAEQRFSWPVIARQVASVYKEVFAEAESKR